MPFLSLSNPANARPTILLHRCEVFKAIEISRNISTLLMSSLLTNRVGLIDIINAANLQIMRTIMTDGHESEEGHQKKKQLHILSIIINLSSSAFRISSLHGEYNNIDLFEHCNTHIIEGLRA